MICPLGDTTTLVVVATVMLAAMGEVCTPFASVPTIENDVVPVAVGFPDIPVELKEAHAGKGPDPEARANETHGRPEHVRSLLYETL
jgi:hypothetical protein